MTAHRPPLLKNVPVGRGTLINPYPRESRHMSVPITCRPAFVTHACPNDVHSEKFGIRNAFPGNSRVFVHVALIESVANSAEGSRTAAALHLRILVVPVAFRISDTLVLFTQTPLISSHIHMRAIISSRHAAENILIFLNVPRAATEILCIK